MNVRTAWICCLLAGIVIFHCEGIKWLGLYRYKRSKDASKSNHFTHDECHLARNKFGFKKRQLRFCKNSNFSFAMGAIYHASKAAIYYCGKTFWNRRWNCSSTHQLPSVSPDLQRGTQEQAVVYAFASAALVYTIGRECSSKNAYCPCISDRNKISYTPNDTHKWGSCDDNMRMAEKFVVRFLGLRRRKRARNRQETYPYGRSRSDSYQYRYRSRMPLSFGGRRRKRRGRRRKRNVLRLMNHHNYEAGIRIMDNWRSLVCKCHGVSGTCTAKVCFYRLTRIDNTRLRSFIRSKYMNAVMVKKDDDHLVRNEYASTKPILPTDLVCITRSPDYCMPDPEVGSVGTIGRKCVSNTSDSSNCEEMCCGRGYHIRVTYFIDKKCHCKLTERYNVKCTSCRKILKHHVCN